MCSSDLGKQLYDLPFSFYDDVNIPHNIFWDYFYVNTPKKSLELYQKLKEYEIDEYIFIHNKSSSGNVFTSEYVENKFKLSKDNVLFINPCINMYNEDHKHYHIAEYVRDKLLLDYVDIIENANIVVLCDSSFFCLATHLKIKTDNCYCYCRTGDQYGYSYHHLWSDKYKSNDSSYKKIIQIN